MGHATFSYLSTKVVIYSNRPEHRDKDEIPEILFIKSVNNEVTADDNPTSSLHIFVDASTKSYGATAYICKDNHSTLVMAKNRVAPVKQLTLPKLELMAAVIGARLSQHLRTTL